MSTISVYIASPEGKNGRNAVANGVVAALAQHYTTQVFRPAVEKGDTFTSVLLHTAGSRLSPAQVTATTPSAVRQDRTGARDDVARAYKAFCAEHSPQACVIVGHDHSPVFDPQATRMDALFAADTQSSVFLAVCTRHRDAAELRATVLTLAAEVREAGDALAGVFVTGCEPAKSAASEDALEDLNVPVWTIPPVDCSDDQEAQASLPVFRDNAPADEVVAAAVKKHERPVTPFVFQADLIDRARAAKRTIVIPESTEPRMLRASNYLLERGVVDIAFVGDKDEIVAAADDLGLSSVPKASFYSEADTELFDQMVAELVRLREKKGMTPEKARTTLKDPTFFGTMLVQLGKADGLVSGSINSTANTVRPALQVIKTAPGAALVSGAFIMCFPTKIALFADCAITPNPTPEQLADIAVQSAKTAGLFGIDPVVGMLSYSTLGSGKGPDVDLVEQATALAREKAPDLKLVGPIQFDAAWSPTVAKAKAPGDPYAGKVNVFIFPDLSAGNIAYKAVQRSSGAVAVGPVLQGLRRPVNDLSRGANVADIINTIALTAVCA